MFNTCPAQPVRVPPELQEVRATVLEAYVRERLDQFAHSLWQKVAPQVPLESFDREVANTYTELPPPEYGQVALETRELQLVFRHDCLALGCSSPQCSLCQHNPGRRCRVNFDKKYLVGDTLKAKCGAVIRVELVDRATGLVFTEEIPGLVLEMSILDGNEYDKKVLDRKLSSQQERQELENCVLPHNKRQGFLLHSSAGAVNSVDCRVVADFGKGRMDLPDLSVSESSEALLSGRKPPFRLLARGVDKQGRDLKIRHAVSEGFVVATRRTRTANKVDIPSVDDHVSKLEHMGRETVKKLLGLKVAAKQAHTNLGLPKNVPDSIVKVGEFRYLAQIAEQDGTLRQKLQQVLKLSKEKWEDARDHAMKAVVPDNRMRAWYSEQHNHQEGLLFTSRMGVVEMERPVALLHKIGQNIQATLLDQLDPRQRELVQNLLEHAQLAWWRQAHPGWSLCSYNSETFLQCGRLEPIPQLPEMPLPVSPKSMHQPNTAGLQHHQSTPSAPPTSAPAMPTHVQQQPAVVGIYSQVVLPQGPGIVTSNQQLPVHLPSVPMYDDPYPAGSKPERSARIVPKPDIDNEKTSSAFANGPSIPSMPGMTSFPVMNPPSIASGEIDMFAQPSLDQGMSALFTHPYGQNELHMHPPVKSLELADNIDVALTNQVRKSEGLAGNPSTGLDSMQSMEVSLEGVQRSMELQKSMEIEFECQGNNGF